MRTSVLLSTCALLLAAAGAEAQPRQLTVDRTQARAALARPEVRAELARGARRSSVDAARIEAHVLRPPALSRVDSETEPRGRTRNPPAGRPMPEARARTILQAAGDAATIRPSRPPVRRVGPSLDVAGFTAAVHEALKDSVAGYYMELRQNGETISRLQWSYSRYPTDGGNGWLPSRRMHVASVSKLISAMALVHLLAAKNISPDAAIGPYLPAYWTQGSNVGEITFRQLLTHRSGFRTPDGASDFMTMRQRVATGVQDTAVNVKNYQNMNFGLMRILIPVLNGDINRTMLETYRPAGEDASYVDNSWDLISTEQYHNYVTANVFAPAGVGNSVDFNHSEGTALAYSFPATGEGWDSGDLRTVSGGAGWVMSADQVLDVMGEFRRGGGIIPPGAAQQALKDGFGVDVVSETPAGTLYNKNGRWTNNGRTEQSLAYFLPEDMELVVLANSQVGRGAAFFRGVITSIYLANLR